MGMDCYSRSGLGILVTFDKFIITKKEKCFDHSYPEDWKLDPKSGKKLWREVDYYNPDIFPEWADSEYDGLYNASIGEYDIVLLDDDDANVLVCLNAAETGSHRSSYHHNMVSVEIDPYEFVGRFEAFKKFMEEKGLWTDTFGLYTYLHISV
jgi:hypothetical protein